MEKQPLPQDDLLDVLEMTEKLEAYMDTLFEDNQRDLSISAVMNATTNCILSQCDSLEEAFLFRLIFFQIFDKALSNIRVKE